MNEASIASESKLPERARELLAPYFPEINLEKVRIWPNGIPFYVPMKAAAYTGRNRIHFARGVYDPRSYEGLALIAHELTHVAQYEKHGVWRFRLMYVKSWLVELFRNRSFNEAYRQNCFEVEARAVEQKVYDDLCNRRG
ncbi:MAG TPA: DUF4157 domain-containing protein [Blastocatellia bacterium]|nr:DUF4157 domain-containing protein [Blastocatellia bacterium]